MERSIVEKLYFLAHKLDKVIFEKKLAKSINGKIKYLYQDELNISTRTNHISSMRNFFFS
jgi:hypothetical protein